MSGLTAVSPAHHTQSTTGLEREMDALAARLREGARDWESRRRIAAELRLEFEQVCRRADMLQLCDALGSSRSLGTLLGLLGPVLAADVAAACNLTASGASSNPTACAPWFAQEPLALIRDGAGYVVSGTCRAVVDAEHREHMLVRARADDYALLPLRAAGVEIRPRRDGGLGSAGLCDVRLLSVHVRDDQLRTLAAAHFERLRTRHLLWITRALCRFATELFEDTLQFLGARPFRDGVLSDLAVVRHRLADLSAHPRLFWAAWRAAAADADTSALRVALLAEVLADQLPVFVKQCQQLHGGRGFLLDFSIARAYRDGLELARLLGSRPQLRRNIADRLPHIARLNSATGAFCSAEHQAFRARVRELVSQHVSSTPARWEESSTAVAELHALFARERITTVRLGRDDGSGGKDFSYSLILAEELMSSAPSGVAVSLMIAAGAVVPLLAREASPELRALLWPRLEQGKAVLSFGITEPDGGSDLLHSLRTHAVEDGDHWILNGRKMFITNGPIADFVLVLARTSDRPGPFHSTFLVVPVAADGVTVSEPYDTLGLRESPTGFVEFRDVRVSKHHVIGRVGLGMHYLADSISEERTLIAIGALALAWTLVHDALARTPDAAARDKLLSWLARLDAVRSLVSETAHSILRGERDYAAAGLLKIAGSEAAQEALECAADAVAQLGELSDEPRYTRALRDTRVFTVFAGTNETLRELVGASVAARARLAKKAPGHG